MKFIDPNGHLYVGRYLDDGYSRDYYLAKLPAPTSQSSPSCTSSPDVCLTRGGNSQYTSMPVTGSPDRFLTNWGNNQYTPLSQPPPSSTTTSATAQSYSAPIPTKAGPQNSPQIALTPGQAGAALVTIGLGIVFVVGFLVSPALLVFPPPYGEYAIFGLDNALAGGMRGVILYDINSGPNATPQGAFAAFGGGELNGFVSWAWTKIP